MNNLLRVFVFLAIIAGVSVEASAAVVNDIRMWHAPDRSRIVFDMDKGVKFSVFTLEKPNRVVIDIARSRLNTQVPATGSTGQFIRRVRVGYPDENLMRVVFDLEKPVRYFIQQLKPVDNYKYRLVIDYYARDDIAPTPKPSKPELPKIPTQPAKPRQPGDDILVMIDAGHGGEDPGALGKRSKEKAVVLSISRKLEQQINKQPGMRAELTRRGDYYIGLRKRTAMARERQADLFVSIHADAFKNSRARGASVYALSPKGATSETAKWLANKENAADLVGGVSLADKEDQLAEVLLDLSMDKTVEQSLNFGREVLKQFKKIGKVHSNRVEQAGFVVLKSPDIPSILVETAYITNPQEERLLNDPKHQYRIANAIVDGIQRYLNNGGLVYAN